MNLDVPVPNGRCIEVVASARVAARLDAAIVCLLTWRGEPHPTRRRQTGLRRCRHRPAQEASSMPKARARTALPPGRRRPRSCRQVGCRDCKTSAPPSTIPGRRSSRPNCDPQQPSLGCCAGLACWLSLPSAPMRPRSLSLPPLPSSERDLSPSSTDSSLRRDSRLSPSLTAPGAAQ